MSSFSPKVQPITALILTITILTLISSSSSSSASDVHDLLPKYNLPKGLLPSDVKSYTLSNTSDFTINIGTKPCYVKFGDQTAYFDKTVRGKLEYGRVSGVSGIQAKKFFVWVYVTGIDVDDKNDMIEFHVGSLSQKMPVKDFQVVRNCKAKGVRGLFDGVLDGLF